jgi:type IV pilus assembly protein PilB
MPIWGVVASQLDLIGSGLRDQLGDILVRKGRLARHELAQAVVEARAEGRRLGEYLVSIGAVYEVDVAQGLAEQYGLRYVNIDFRDLDPAISALIPEAVAKRLVMLPLRADADIVVVAVADPTDVFSMDELQMLVQRPTELVVSERASIEEGIRKLYAEASVWSNGEEFARVEAPMLSTIDAFDEGASAPAIEAVNRILRRAIELRASDIHWVPRTEDLLVRIRIDGVMRDLEVVPLEFRAAIVARLKVMAMLDIAERRLPQDGRVSITFEGVAIDLRMAVLPSIHGEEVVLRIAYIGREGSASLDDLSLDDNTRAVFTHALRQPGGAIVVAGPTGSGKTTTVYAALAALNDGSRTIVSIEDPVEADVEGIVQIEINSRIGLTFASGLRTILRADPDVIFVGEVRDAETAEIALQAAITGHLVLTTIHAESAAAGLVRLRDLGVHPTTIGSAVRCVSSQRLVRKPCPRCVSTRPVQPDELASIGLPETIELTQPEGCSHCGNTGYIGRVGVFEALAVTHGIRDVLSGSAGKIQEAAALDGMRTLHDAARDLAAAGVTTAEEVLRVCGEVDVPRPTA